MQHAIFLPHIIDDALALDKWRSYTIILITNFALSNGFQFTYFLARRLAISVCLTSICRNESQVHRVSSLNIEHSKRLIALQFLSLSLAVDILTQNS